MFFVVLKTIAVIALHVNMQTMEVFPDFIYLGVCRTFQASYDIMA